MAPDLRWNDLANLWNCAAAAPAVEAEDTIVCAMTAIRDLLSASYGSFMFSMRSTASRFRGALPTVDSWRPLGFLRDPEEPAERIAARNEWIAEHAYRVDPGTRAMAAVAGRPRVHRQDELPPPGEWKGSPSYEILGRLGVSSRLLVGVPLTPSLEAHMVFDRESSKVFDSRDKATALVALSGLKPHLYRLARLYGADGGELLTEREKGLLKELLKGGTEKEVAATAGLTPRSAHQRIVQIYRKLGVSTRAELMARFLEGGAPAQRLPHTVLVA